MPLSLSTRIETWPLRTPFRISRNTRSEVSVVVVELGGEGRAVGRGECVPYAHYGEQPRSVVDQIATVAPAIESGADRAALQAMLPRGAARNAVDSALWDLEAKRRGMRAWEIAGIPEPRPAGVYQTVSLAPPPEMAAAVRALDGWPLLKLKVGPNDAVDCVQAVRLAVPTAGVIVDANEGWTMQMLVDAAPRLAALGVRMIEQPLPAGADAELQGYRSPVPLGADESCHDRADLAKLVGRYAIVSIKLDKTGGLTEALLLARAARDAGFRIMVSCMNSTSLAVAPATMLCDVAEIVDIDGPLWLAKDRVPGLDYSGARIHPPAAALWG